MFSEPKLGPSYSCIKCERYYHHKSYTELPCELQHSLHPKHPLILFNEMNFFKDKKYSKCKVCRQYRGQYTYGCSHCNFNIHNKCASLPLTIEFEVHEHPLTRIWRSMKFTCDLCGKKDTDYGFYYCLSFDFVTHLNCALDEENREDINLMKLKDGEFNESENEDLELDESNDSATYIVKKIILCNGFTYKCNKCDFDLDVQCSLILDILTHKGHEHCLCLQHKI
ncbi:uncharacterized protein LOC115961878 [Quercus lobata]|uniref:uncharacterized protein LOC115961878 n=1 Tax=Quercus lobata TaxID=97700 RepID=UPI001244E5E9|nr:uncharacterized protein LOC115961878 [Quercus lobata]